MLLNSVSCVTDVHLEKSMSMQQYQFVGEKRRVVYGYF